MMRNLLLVIATTIWLIGCQNQVQLKNGRGRPTHYESPDSPGMIKSVGIESQDVVSVTDAMVRDILASPAIVKMSRPVRIVIDARYFHNDGSSVINKNIFTDRLRISLQRAAKERLHFTTRHYADMVEDERELRKSGAVGSSDVGKLPKPTAYDLRMGGRIASHDAVDSKTGLVTRYHLITFELVRPGSGDLAWSNMYEMKKTALDDVVNR